MVDYEMQKNKDRTEKMFEGDEKRNNQARRV